MSKDTDLTEFIDDTRQAVQQAERDESFGPGNERWEFRPLSELIEPVLGKTPKRSEDKYWGGDIQWASAKDVSQCETRHLYDTAENMTEAGQEASNAKTLPAGTVVVIARGATMGRIAQLGKPMTFNQTCYGLTTTDELLDDYLYYAWQYVFGQVQAVSYGTVFDSITMKSFKDIEIPVPPLELQERIGNALGAIDDRRTLNKQLIDELNETCQTILKSRLNEFTNEIGGDPFEEGKTVPLDDIVEIELGSSPKSEYYNEEGEGLPFFQGSKNFGQFYPEVETWCSKPNKIAKQGDVLISIRAPVGDLNRAQTECCVGRGVTGLRMKNFGNDYLYYLLREYSGRWSQYASGTTFNSINKSNIMDFKVPNLPASVISEFNGVVEPMTKYIDNAHMESKDLADLRDLLLPKLLSGEIRLPT